MWKTCWRMSSTPWPTEAMNDVTQSRTTVLLVGGGGREHAIAWRLMHDDPALELIAAPGNPGIARIGRCVDVAATDIDGLLALAASEGVSLTVVGPEAPLAAGIVDRFRAAGMAVFGPTAAAAEIETSKAFSKELMESAGVPTARAIICRDVATARAAVRLLGAPVVIKASGLAAGKGVIICPTEAEADAAIESMLSAHAFGAAGDTVLVEEFMEGEELSLFVLTDGTRAIPLPPAQDHKRLLAGDRGPNTGGMGAYAPVSLAGADPAESPVVRTAMERVIHPVLRAMAERGRPFTGLLYAGLMLTRDGPRVVEFNCRFGDPETQAVLPVLQMTPSLLEVMRLIGSGAGLPAGITARASGHAVTTVVAAAGYPERAATGDPLQLPPAAPGTLVFHAGTRTGDDGALLSAGGRVLAVTGTGDTFDEAAARSRAGAAATGLHGCQYRDDIGWRELARRAGASGN
jgi:phosphoribosylamine---glycine ligase